MNKSVFAAVALALFVGAYAATPYQYNEFYYQRSTLFELLPVDSTDIVFLGNSITNGCEWHELFGMQNVKNRGISSDVVQGVRDRIDPILKGAPKKIIFLCGINDISHDVSADSLATAIGNLVDYIHANSPSTKLYVESLLPINNSFARYKALTDKEQVVRDVNLLLEGMAAEKDFVWLDIYPLFLDEEGNLDARYTNDGLHVTGNAYLKWRDFLLPYVME